jgi:hypothetical protein
VFFFSLTTLLSFFPLCEAVICAEIRVILSRREDWLRQSERIVDPDAKGITNPRRVHEKAVKNPTSFIEPEV